MSWSPLLPLRDARKLKAGKPAIAASVSAGEGNQRPKLTLLLRPGMLDGITWLTPGAGLQVLVGHAEHAGMLRIMPDGLHILGKVALAKPAGSAVSLKLPLPPWMAAGKRAARAIEFEWKEDWIEVTVPPEWRGAPAAAPAAAPLAPKPAAPAGNGTPPERGKLLAAQAAEMARRKAGL